EHPVLRGVPPFFLQDHPHPFHPRPRPRPRNRWFPSPTLPLTHVRGSDTHTPTHPHRITYPPATPSLPGPSRINLRYTSSREWRRSPTNWISAPASTSFRTRSGFCSSGSSRR